MYYVLILTIKGGICDELINKKEFIKWLVQMLLT